MPTTAPERHDAATPGRRLPAHPGVLTGIALLVVAALVVAGTVELTHGDGGLAGVGAALLRFVRYAATLLAVGGFVFFAVVYPAGRAIESAGRRVTVGAAVVGAGVTLLALPAQGAYLVGEVAAAADTQVLAAVVDSGFGTSVLVGLIGLLALALASARLPHPAAAGLGAIGIVLALGAFLLTGHSSTSEPRALGMAANIIHVGAAAVWLGGLVLLPLALRASRRADDPLDAARLVARFSTAATVALVGVAVAGGALAWVEVRALAALTTPYGAVLLGKVALVGGVVALGAYNNRRLVPAIRADRAGAGPAWARLARVARLEAAGLVGVLAVTAVLVNITPARVTAGIGEQVDVSGALGSEHTANVLVEPAHVGRNEVHLYVFDSDGRLDDVGAVEYRFSAPGEDTDSATATPAAVGPGHYLHTGTELAEPGDWDLEVVAEVDGTEERAVVTIPVGTGEWQEEVEG